MRNQQVFSKQELETPIKALKDFVKYCEDQQIYDKMGKYNDPYYKAKQWLKSINES